MGGSPAQRSLTRRGNSPKAQAWSPTVLFELGSFWQNTHGVLSVDIGPKTQKNSRELMRTQGDWPLSSST
jgi:hypothetical protein